MRNYPNCKRHRQLPMVFALRWIDRIKGRGIDAIPLIENGGENYEEEGRSCRRHARGRGRGQMREATNPELGTVASMRAKKQLESTNWRRCK